VKGTAVAPVEISNRSDSIPLSGCRYAWIVGRTSTQFTAFLQRLHGGNVSPLLSAISDLQPQLLRNIPETSFLCPVFPMTASLCIVEVDEFSDHAVVITSASFTVVDSGCASLEQQLGDNPVSNFRCHETLT
jgi:hypothetical protein